MLLGAELPLILKGVASYPGWTYIIPYICIYVVTHALMSVDRIWIILGSQPPDVMFLKAFRPLLKPVLRSHVFEAHQTTLAASHCPTFDDINPARPHVYSDYHIHYSSGLGM